MLYILLFSMLFPGLNDTSWFDFNSPRENQTGNYEISNSCVLENNSVHLIATDNWYAPEWSSRFKFVLTNSTTSALTDYPMYIDLSTMPPELFDLAQVDGEDFKLFMDDGTEVNSVWLEYYDFIARKGILWFKLPSVPVNTTIFHLYFGSELSGNTSTWDSVFLYSGEVEGAYWMYPDGSDVSIAPLGFDIDFQIGINPSSNLAGNSVTSINTDTGAINASGPYSIGANTDGSDIAVPYSMAGTDFVFPAVRNDDVFHFYSPTGDATVNIYVGASLITSVLVPDGTLVTVNNNISDGSSYHITSDRPVVAYHNTVEPYDGYPLIPSATSLFGGKTGNVSIAAVNDNTNVTVYYSNGTSASYVVNSSSYLTLPNPGSQGDGDAIHLVSDQPIGAISYGDGDGGEAVSFYPERFMAQKFRFPRDGEYLYISALRPSTVCTVSSSDGTVLSTLVSTSYAPEFPGRIRTTSNLNAGNFLDCDGPVVAYIEDSVLNDERHLLSVKDHRPIAFPEPFINLIDGTEEYKFLKGPAVVETPDFETPYMITAWDEIKFYEPTEIPEGCEITYQISQDGGTTWLYFDGSSWIEAAGYEDANSGVWLQYAFSSLSVIPRIKIRAILRGNGGYTPVQGPISVSYNYDDGASALVISTISSPQQQGQAFDVTIEAQDDNGRVLSGYNKSLGLSLSKALRFSPAFTPKLVNGQITFKMAVLDPGEDISIYVTDGNISTESTSFDVLKLDTTDLIKIAGDGQWGAVDTPLSNPFVVQVLNENNRGVAFQMVEFTVVSGSGKMENGGTTIVAETDADGYAGVIFSPSDGLNEVEASVEGVENRVSFTVRGDNDLDAMHPSLGSTSCKSSPVGSDKPLNILFPLMIFVTLLIFRRKYSKL